MAATTLWLVALAAVAVNTTPWTGGVATSATGTGPAPAAAAGAEGGCPARCECTEAGDSNAINCTLPSGVLMFDEFGDGISFQCYEGELRCEELPQREPIGALGVGDTLRSAALRQCALPADEPLICALRRRGALGGTLRLTLQAPRRALGPRTLRGLTALTMLRITEAGEAVTELPLEALAELPALRHFTLDNAARLQLLAPLPPLPLEVLELADDALRSLPAGAFRHLPHLRRLSLWRNHLRDLPPDLLLGLESLEELSLSSNELVELPEGLLSATPRLRRLDLYDNALVTLGRASLAGLHHLQQVQLQNNRASLQLEEGAFAQLPSLQQLDVSGCGLAALPGGTFTGSHALLTLRLASNALRTLPAGVLRDQRALRLLDLSRNAIDALPPGLFAELHNLTELHLDRNQLRELPGLMFVGLSSLETLSLSHNGLHRVAPDAFVGVRALRRLAASHNALALGVAEPHASQYQLLAADHSPFNALELLTHLDLSHNRVQRLQEDWRLVMLDLQRLDLSWNNITELNYVNMNFLSSGVEVDLRHNNISTVELWAPTDGDAVFLIDDNPFACDCHLPPLADALAAPRARAYHPSRPILVATNARCAAPPALRGRVLRDVPRELLECPLPAPACPPHCRCTLRPDYLDVDCYELPDVALPPPSAHGLDALELRLRSRPGTLAGLPRFVRAVRLDSLNMTSVPPAPPGVRLDLADNLLARLPPDLLTGNRTVRLAGNPLACDCGAAGDVAALQRTAAAVLDYGAVRCRDGAPLRLVAADRLCEARDAAALGGALAALALLAAVVAVLVRRYHVECLVCAHRCGCCPPDDGDDAEAREYDAFVSFAHRDCEFVAEQLVPRLEGAPHSLRLCVHYRDWVAGDWIPAQIARSVERSRHTVVVLSKHFLSSVWGLLEFREAHVRALREGRARVVVVLLEDVAGDPRLDAELRAYLATNTYLHRDDPRFWTKLADALRRRRGPLVALKRRLRSRRAACLPHPAHTANKLTRVAIDAQLTRDGRLVNAAATAPSL